MPFMRKYKRRRLNQRILPRLLGWFKTTGIKEAMLLYGVGDHGGGPREPEIEAVHRLQKLDDFPQVVYETPEVFLAKLPQLKKTGQFSREN